MGLGTTVAFAGNLTSGVETVMAVNDFTPIEVKDLPAAITEAIAKILRNQSSKKQRWKRQRMVARPIRLSWQTRKELKIQCSSMKKVKYWNNTFCIFLDKGQNLPHKKRTVLIKRYRIFINNFIQEDCHFLLILNRFTGAAVRDGQLLFLILYHCS